MRATLKADAISRAVSSMAQSFPGEGFLARLTAMQIGCQQVGAIALNN